MKSANSSTSNLAEVPSNIDIQTKPSQNSVNVDITNNSSHPLSVILKTKNDEKNLDKQTIEVKTSDNNETQIVVKKFIKPKKDPNITRPNLLSEQHNTVFRTTRKLIQDASKLIDETKYHYKIKKAGQSFEFVRVFSTKGVQGVVGFLRCKKNKQIVVFKTSLDVNRTTEHEYTIMESLNPLRPYCPHFVRSYGMLNIPISTDFIFESNSTNLFHQDEESLPRNVLLMEHINKLPFYRLCRNCTNKNVVVSQMLQVLMALQIAQKKVGLTHYDLHMGNVLMQLCEKNSVFVYIYEGEKYLIPTYGFFPMIIDTGISYGHALLDKPIMSNVDNYDRGCQTMVYDNLNDTHHFLLNTFYYIEVDSDAYDSLSNKIKLMFRHLPVLRKSGWKSLPNDMSDIIIDRIRKDSLKYRKYDLFHEYDKGILELLNNLIKLPLKHRHDTSFTDCFDAFMDEFHLLGNMEDLSEDDNLFILRELIEAINKYYPEYMKVKSNPKRSKSVVGNFKNNLINRLSVGIQEFVDFEEVDYEKLLISAIVLTERLESNYSELIQDHQKIIDDAYSKTVVKSPLDVMVYMAKNLTPHFEIDKDTIVYVWDADKETNKKFNCSKLKEDDIKKVNSSYFIRKGDVLLSLLK